MSSSITRLQVGIVGVEPGIVLINTTAPEADIFAPGFINSLEQSNNVDVQKGDFVFIKYEDGTLQEMAIPDVGDGGVITLIPVAGDFNAGGPIAGGQNVGGGAESFKDVLAGLMRFRTLVAGANVTIVEGSDTITIDTPTPSGGVINDGQNLGAGEGVFAAASGDKLQFKSLTAGANITLTPTGNDITINATSLAGGTITDGVNLGSGNGVFESAVGADLRFKGLKSGANVTIVPDGDSLTISASTLGGGDISNGINVGGGSEVFKEVASPNMIFRTLLAGSNVTINENANDITISASGGGGGGSFDYENAYWVAQNGSDLNDGKSIDKPFLTIQAAVAAIAATAPTASNVINISDNGVYTGVYTLPNNCAIAINAPGATLSASANNMFTMNGGALGLSVGRISASGFRLFNCTNATIFIDAVDVFGDITNDVSNSTRILADVDNQIGGDVIISSNGGCTIRFKSISGNVIDTSPAPSSLRITLTGTQVAGNISSVNSAIYGEVYRCDGTVSGILQGMFDQVLYGDTRFDGETFAVGPVNGQPYKTFVWNAAQTVALNASNYETYANSYIYYTGASGYGRFQLDQDSGIPVGTKISMYQSVNDAQAGAYEGTGVIIDSASTIPGVAYTKRNGSWIHLVKTVNGATDRWTAYGDLWQSNEFSSFLGVYVSKLIGSDVTGTGSIDAPFASIGAAIAFAGAPVNPTSIVILDGETYIENVVLNNPNVNLIGRTAIILSAGSNAVEVSHGTGTTLIDVGSIVGGLNRSIYHSAATGNVVSLTDVLLGDVEVVAGAGRMYLSGIQIDGTITAGALASVYYNVTTRSGSNIGSVKGIDANKATGGFEVENGFIADGLVYPVADGLAGEFMTTDGAGNLSFAANGGIIYVDVAGITQAAAVGTGYINSNAALTTITLPAVASVGSVVAVQGKGVAGWVLQAFAGQTIHYFGVDTTVGGALASTARYDTVQVVCIVANTEWAVTFAGGSGLTVS